MAFERVGIQAVVEGLGKFQQGIRSINEGMKSTVDIAKEVEAETGKVSQSLQVVGAGLVAAGGATLAFLGSATRLAARVETLGVVTERLGQNIGLSKEEVEGFVEAIRVQGITLQAARGAFARMVQSQIDVAEGAKLARLAQDAAVIANVNSSEAFERLVFTITSGNVRMARTLGLQVSFQQAYEDLAEQLGITTEELTQQQKVQARTNAVLAAGTSIVGSYDAAMDTAGKRVLSLDRLTEEFRRELGEAWLPIMFEAVKAIEGLLKKFEELDDDTKETISLVAGVAAVLAVLTGGALIAAPALLSAAASAAALNIALLPIIVTLGAVALAIGAVIVAGVKLVQFQRDLRQKQSEAETAFEDWRREIVRTSDSVEEYNAEVRRVNQVIEEQGILGKLFAETQEEMTEAQFEAAKAAQEADARLIGAAQATLDAEAAAEGATDAVEDLRTEEEKLADAAEAAAAKQKELQQELSDLTSIVDGKVTESVEDFRDDIDDLNQQLEDLETEQLEKIAELEVDREEEVARALEKLRDLRQDEKILLAEIAERNRKAEEDDKERSAAQILRERERLETIREGMSEQQEIIDGAAQGQVDALVALSDEYAEKEAAIREEIAETQEAFNDATKRMIFDMFQQRLALDGLTDEELDLLRQVAGPEGFGILDEAQAALLEQLDDLAEALQEEGDQSEFAAEKAFELFDVISDGTTAVEDLDEAIRNVKPLSLIAVRDASGREIFIPAEFQSAFLAGGRTGGGAGLVAQSAADTPLPQTTEVGPGQLSEGDIFEMTVNTAAPAEDIVSDFQMMAAQSTRVRGGFIQ